LTDWDGSVTGVAGTIYQVSTTGQISIIYRPPAPEPVDPGPDPDGDGYDNRTGLPVGVTTVPLSVSPTGLVYKGIPVNADGSRYVAEDAPVKPGPAAATWTGQGPKGYGTYVLDGPGGQPGTFVGDPRVPSSTTQQFGSGGGGGGSGGGGVASGSQAAYNLAAEKQKLEAQTNAAIKRANAEADAAIRVAQARAQAGDAGDRGALERLNIELQARAAEFEKTYGLSLQQFEESKRRNSVEEEMTRGRLRLEAANSFKDAVSSTDPIALRAFLAAGGGNIANALQGGATARSTASDLPAARILQTIEDLDSTPAPVTGGGGGGLSTGGGTGAGTGGGTGTGVGGGTGTGTTPTTTTPAAPQFTPTAGLDAPPEGFATWGDWLKKVRPGMAYDDYMGQTVRDVGGVEFDRRGNFQGRLVVNPELEALEKNGYSGGTRVIDSEQALYDYLNQIGAASYAKQNSQRAQSNPYPTMDTTQAWSAVTAASSGYNALANGPATPRPSTVAASQAAAAAGPSPSIIDNTIAVRLPNGSMATILPGQPVPTGGVIIDRATGAPAGAPAATAPASTVSGAGGGLSTTPERRYSGGPTRAPVVMTGDATARDPFSGGAEPELIINRTGAPLDIIKSDDVSQMMRGGGGLARSMQVPRFATGTGQLSTPGTFVEQSYVAPPVASTSSSSRRRGTATPTPTPAPTPAAGTTTTTPTQSTTTVQTPAGPVTSPGTVPTQTTTTVTPTPVANPAPAGGGLSTTPAPTPQPVAAVPAPLPQQPAPVTTPAPVAAAPVPVTQPTPTALATGGGGLSTGTTTTIAEILAGTGLGNPTDLGVTPADQPYLDQVGAIRDSTELPAGVNPYNVDWDMLDPVLRESYLKGAQSKYGIPIASTAFEQARYALPGQSRGGLSMSY